MNHKGHNMNETKLLVLNNELTKKSEWGANIHSWTDKAKFLSTAYNNANILVDYTMIRPEYKKLEGEPRTQIYQSLVNQLNDIILDKDSKLADMITIFKQCVDVELPGMYDKETLFTNYVNFIFKYYKGLQIRIDSIYEDGLELANILETNDVCDPTIFTDFFRDQMLIEDIQIIDRKGNEQFDTYVTNYRVREVGLYLNKAISSLNKYSVYNYVKHGSYTLLRDKQSDIYFALVDAFKELDKLPVMAKVYLNLKEFPKREFMALIKDDCIQLF